MKKVIILGNDTTIFYKKIRFYRFLKFLGYHFELKYKDDSVKKSEEINNIIKILNTKGRKNTYSLIYDYACDVLDQEFVCHNLCDFKNDRCASKRNKNSKHHSCCEGTKRGLCKHFDKKTKRCGIKSIACKLFVCPYLMKKGVKYRVNKVVYLKYFLSFRQKTICYASFFEDKDQVIKKFMNIFRWY